MSDKGLQQVLCLAPKHAPLNLAPALPELFGTLQAFFIGGVIVISAAISLYLLAKSLFSAKLASKAARR